MNNHTPGKDFPNNWREAPIEMQLEWSRLQQEVVQLRADRAALCKALVALLGDEISLSEDEILSQMGKEQPIREFLDELRSQFIEN